jgi:hypothetical protein
VSLPILDITILEDNTEDATSKWIQYYRPLKKLLGARKKSFDSIFLYLSTLGRPPVIIETGTYREENNYTGDGCSTLLFDNFIEYHGGTFHSVDIDLKACALASANTKHAHVVTMDSVEFLGTLDGKCDLLYLDSYNITDWSNDWAPAAHHLKELFAAKNIIKPGTLIVVDDNTFVAGKRQGKGRLIYELMDALCIEPFIDGYQVGWIWEEEDTLPEAVETA